MRCRKNVKDLSPNEKRRFIRAINGLKAMNSALHPGSQSRYDDYVEIHRSAMDAMVMQNGVMTYPGWGHMDSAFFPWHRELLFRFEEELRTIEPEVTIPYWDWTRGQSEASTAWPFTHDFIGVDGTDNANDRVQRESGAPTPYPYEFDPQAWTVVVKDQPTEPSFLRRDFHDRLDAPDLPRNDSVVTGTGSSFRQAIGTTTFLDLRVRSEDLHNLVHRWVNGNMITASSPNDPVFWLHHAQIDRMWTLWQHKHPGATPYVHTGGHAGHGLHDTLIFHATGDPAPWTGTATPAQLIDGHTMHGTSVWYASDQPEVTLQSGPSLSFGAIPQGMTQYRAAHFRIRTCRQVRFRIVSAPSGNFGLTPLGAQFVVEPDLAADAVDGYVWVQFAATGGGTQLSSMTVEAFIVDDEGYYASAEGGEHVLGTFTIDLSASITPRDDNAVVLVLDRSGSMASPAGGMSTRSQLMRGAVSVFHTLLRPADEIGVVSFDDLTDDLLPLTSQATGLGTTLSGNGLDPRGLTAIGRGLQAGAAMLGGASHTNRSLLVLTDGNQNVHPYIHELPAGTVTSRTYAIGFGLPGEVSDAALHEITQNTRGDLIVTGLLDTQQERYQLTKYFVQMLAGITNANVILDPQAELLLGSEHVATFQVSEADVSIDVIMLAPAAVLADMMLRTPGGSEIDPSVAATEPNISFHLGTEVAFYRIDLPALPADVAGSHAGRWQIVTRLRKEEDVRALLRETEFPVDWDLIRRLYRTGGLPYSNIVHCRSDLDFAAAVNQSSFGPGAEMIVTASLREYGVPHSGTAAVWAELNPPDGDPFILSLRPVGGGRFEATSTATAPGVHQFRVRAEGATSRGNAFTREKTLTVGIDAGAQRCPDWCCSRATEPIEPRPVTPPPAQVAPAPTGGRYVSGAEPTPQRRASTRTAWAPEADRRAEASQRAAVRQQLITESDDPALLLFPRIMTEHDHHSTG